MWQAGKYISLQLYWKNLFLFDMVDTSWNELHMTGIQSVWKFLASIATKLNICCVIKIYF